MKTKNVVIAAVLLAAGAVIAGESHAQSTNAAAAAPDRVKTAVAEWKRMKLGIQEYIDAMPEDGISFKPTPEIRSFAEQMVHIAGTNYAFGAAVTNQSNPYDAANGKNPEQMAELRESKAALRSFVLGSYDFVIQGLEKLDASKMDEEVQFFNLKMTRAFMLAKALEHHAHHRGQTTIYLRLKGVTPPSERLF